ncbi:hypothetical protein [Dokdonella sp.]|uniref:hypothetical protein n=1 Tax=Dokdonella sp. TaxID=2291710 RepID=UPI003C391799
MKLSLQVARAVSILGHPMLVMSLAAGLAIRSSGSSTRSSIVAMTGIILLGAIVLGYSALQVRLGRWRHVDASVHSERTSLNVLLLLLLSTIAALAWLSQGMSPLTAAMALSAAIVLLALMLSKGCKLSLHVAFIVFAAFVPGTIVAGLAFGALGAGVAWSRLRLGRHTPIDLVAGLLAGVAAGIVWLTN